MSPLNIPGCDVIGSSHSRYTSKPAVTRRRDFDPVLAVAGFHIATRGFGLSLLRPHVALMPAGSFASRPRSWGLFVSAAPCPRLNSPYCAAVEVSASRRPLSPQRDAETSTGANFKT